MKIDFGNEETVAATRLALYLPDRDRGGNPVRDHARWVHEARVLFTTLFGGCTCLTGAGMWRSAARAAFIDETSVIVASWAGPEEVIRHMERLRGFIAAFLTAANQETVAVEFAGRLHFVSAPADARVTA